VPLFHCLAVGGEEIRSAKLSMSHIIWVPGEPLLIGFLYAILIIMKN
jgi:hypothetical protein